MCVCAVGQTRQAFASHKWQALVQAHRPSGSLHRLADIAGLDWCEQAGVLQQPLTARTCPAGAVQGGMLQQCGKCAAAGPLLQPQQLMRGPHLVPETPLALLPQRLWCVEDASAGLHQPHAHAGDWQDDSPCQTCRQRRTVGRQTRLLCSPVPGEHRLAPGSVYHQCLVGCRLRLM